jgi:hypothetical protein
MNRPFSPPPDMIAVEPAPVDASSTERRPWGIIPLQDASSLG